MVRALQAKERNSIERCKWWPNHGTAFQRNEMEIKKETARRVIHVDRQTKSQAYS